MAGGVSTVGDDGGRTSVGTLRDALLDAAFAFGGLTTAGAGAFSTGGIEEPAAGGDLATEGESTFAEVISGFVPLV